MFTVEIAFNVSIYLFIIIIIKLQYTTLGKEMLSVQNT